MACMKVHNQRACQSF